MSPLSNESPLRGPPGPSVPRRPALNTRAWFTSVMKLYSRRMTIYVKPIIELLSGATK